MNVHHLNCATMCPIGGRLVSGRAGEPARLVCHCLLIETDDGLVLVDTGLGLDDVAEPARRLGRATACVLRPARDPEETAVRQVERLGFTADDVRHIVVTHLDLDHAGGLPDFPGARVHIFEDELDAALSRRTGKERNRYRTAHWAHEPDWRPYSVQGEPWFGFECVRDLEGLPPEVLLVPLTGHSRGHCGVAVDSGKGWLLHCGDAYFFRDEMAAEPRCPAGLRWFQSAVQMDKAARLHNQKRLRALAREHGDQVSLFCAHDPVELADCAGRA